MSCTYQREQRRPVQCFLGDVGVPLCTGLIHVLGHRCYPMPLPAQTFTLGPTLHRERPHRLHASRNICVLPGEHPGIELAVQHKPPKKRLAKQPLRDLLANHPNRMLHRTEKGVLRMAAGKRFHAGLRHIVRRSVLAGGEDEARRWPARIYEVNRRWRRILPGIIAKVHEPFHHAGPHEPKGGAKPVSAIGGGHRNWPQARA